MSSSPIEPLLVDERQAAKMLGISKSSLKNHRRKGLIPFVKIERLVRYQPQDLRDFVTALRSGPIQVR